MRRTELKRMSSDRLWTLRVELAGVLRQKILSMKAQLEDRLKKLRVPASARRPYPEIQPKYRNPAQPSETWAGRGKKPRWLVAQLRLGKRIEDFRIKVRKKSRIAGRLARIGR
ncbi:MULTISPECIES: H-NS histone family protein [Bradyrhizobium]|uniref:H-NS histone family protein n=1 Tax=Bradyrhizobium elkanii TaxID=29448 RepID=UPI0004168C07|nr:H-NS histone family protein [Bradyrhizobium elkanii]